MIDFLGYVFAVVVGGPIAAWMGVLSSKHRHARRVRLGLDWPVDNPSSGRPD